MIGVGIVRLADRDADLQAASARYGIEPELHNLGTAGVLFLLAAGVRLRLRGADRRRGDQQRRAGVPEAKSKNAATTLALLGTIAVTMFDRRHLPGRSGPACSDRPRPPRYR